MSQNKKPSKGKTTNYVQFASKHIKATHYLVENTLPKGMLIAVTAQSGHGKTAICIRLAFCVAMGIPLHNEVNVERHMVVYMAGENPGDIALRFEAIRLSTPIGIDENNKPIFASQEELSRWLRIVQERFGVRNEEGDVSQNSLDLIDDIKDNLTNSPEDVRKAGLGLVIIDTAAAFNSDSIFDENHNAQQLATARAMRYFTENLPDQPCVLALCHATKSADSKTISARGASSFLAEVDGQILIWQHGKTAVEMRPDEKKWRSRPFSPMLFTMRLHEFKESEVPLDNFGHGTSTIAADYCPEETLNPRLKAAAVINGKKTYFRAYDVIKIMAKFQAEQTSPSKENFATELNCSKTTASSLLSELIELDFIQKISTGGNGTADFLVMTSKALILLDLSGDSLHLGGEK